MMEGADAWGGINKMVRVVLYVPLVDTNPKRTDQLAQNVPKDITLIHLYLKVQPRAHPVELVCGHPILEKYVAIVHKDITKTPQRKTVVNCVTVGNSKMQEGKVHVCRVLLVNIKIKNTNPIANRIAVLVLPLTMLKLLVLVVQLVDIKMKTAKPGANPVWVCRKVVVVQLVVLHVQAAPRM